jgi:SAM-dependent methyltransferase
MCADAQLHRFEAGFDFCFSRFGTMFFQSPKIAMKNIGAALKPNGQLLMIVWRAIEHNEWLSIPKGIAQAYLPPPPDHGRTCGPGPFSMADSESVKDILSWAGFSDIHFEAMDVPVMVGSSLQEAVDVQLQLGPAGELMREAGDLGEARKSQIEAELRRRLAQYETARGVVMDSSSWCITAKRG